MDLGAERERLPTHRAASPLFLVVLSLLVVGGALMAGSPALAVLVLVMCGGFYGLFYALYNRGPRLQAVHDRGIVVRVRGQARRVPWAQVSAVERRRVETSRPPTIWFDIHVGRATDPDAFSVSVTEGLDGRRTTERAVNAIVRGAGLTWTGDHATRAPAEPPARR